jgi:hypothetical protein
MYSRTHRWSLVALLVAGCSSSTAPNPTPGPASVPMITVISPTGVLQGTVNSVTGPFAVHVQDSATGRPLTGVTVNWTVSQGFGSLQAQTTPSDTSGIAINAMTLDRHPGPAEITASLSNGKAVRFTVAAVPGPVATVASAVGQLAGVSGGIDTIGVFVADAYGNGVRQAVVHFLTTDGVVRDTILETDGNGYAFTPWFLPLRPGSATATAIVVPQAPVNFTTTIGASCRGVSGASSYSMCVSP